MPAPNGIQMILKAMGLDPAELMQKGAELEQAARALGGQLHTAMLDLDARLTRMENMLVFLANATAQQTGRTHPAGDSTLEHSITKDKQINGRIS